MRKKLALGLAAVLAVLAAVVALQPASFTVERSEVIEASPAVIQAHIENLRAMDEWSPWTHMDPAMKVVYEGPAAGVGARSSWEGPQMGRGRLTVMAVAPEREVEMKLEMLAPMPATNRVLFVLAPEGEATRVTWRMHGTNGFAGKAAALVMDMDAMVGGAFAQGLASLKAVVEARKLTAD